MMRRLLGVVLTCVCMMRVAIGADAPLFGPAPAWVDQSIDRPEPQADEAAVQVLFSDMQVRFHDKAVESYSASAVRVQTSQGLAALGTFATSWKPDSDTLTIHKITVVRGDEEIDVLGDGADLTILRREGGLEYAALTGVLTAILPIPGLRVGDTIETSFTLRRADPVVADLPENDLVWPATPMRRVRFRALWPEKMPMRWKASDSLPRVEQKLKDGFWTVSFQLDDMSPLPQPTGAPARFAALRRLELTTFRNWQEVSKRLAPLYREASTLDESSPLRAEIKRIEAASQDPTVRAAAALRLVQDQVRYVFLGMNDGGLVPASADLTWQRRYGDCKGKTALLLALLRELGVSAEAAAVNLQLGDGLDTRLPGVGAFDHIIVRAQIGGKTYWLDGTRTGDRRLEAVAVPPYDWALPLVPKGSELVRLQPTPPQEPTITHVLNIDASAGLRVPASFRADAVFRGDAATTLKLALDNIGATQREHALRAYWQAWLEASEAETVSSAFDEETGALRLKAEGTVRMNWAGGRFEAPHMVLGYRPDFSRPPGTDTSAPYAVAFPVFLSTVQTIVLPQQPGAFTLAGEDYEQIIAGVEYRRQTRLKDNVFNAEASVRSVAREFPASEAKEAEQKLLQLLTRGLYVNAPANYQYTSTEVAEIKLDSATAYVDRGVDLMGQNRLDLALLDFNRAIELDAKNDDAYANRSLVHVYMRQVEAARRDLQAAGALNPDNVVALRSRGVLALAERDVQSAIALLSEALDKEQNNLAFERRATAYMIIGDLDRALADAKAARRLSPTWTAPYEVAAEILVRQGALEQARDLATDVIVAAGNTVASHSVAMRIYMLTGDRDLARAQADEAVKLGAGGIIYATRAELQSDPAARKADMDKALEIDPRSPEVLSKLIWSYMQTFDYSAALSTIERLEDVTDLDSFMLNNRGLAYFMVEPPDPERGRAAFDRARELAGSARELQSSCKFKTTVARLVDVARADCDAALAMDPTCMECLEARSKAYLRLERFEDALRDLDSLIGRSSEQNAGWMFGRGIARLRLGQEAEGNADIASARALSPLVDQEYARFELTP